MWGKKTENAYSKISIDEVEQWPYYLRVRFCYSHDTYELFRVQDNPGTTWCRYAHFVWKEETEETEVRLIFRKIVGTWYIGVFVLWAKTHLPVLAFCSSSCLHQGGSWIPTYRLRATSSRTVGRRGFHSTELKNVNSPSDEESQNFPLPYSVFSNVEYPFELNECPSVN